MGQLNYLEPDRFTYKTSEQHIKLAAGGEGEREPPKEPEQGYLEQFIQKGKDIFGNLWGKVTESLTPRVEGVRESIESAAKRINEYLAPRIESAQQSARNLWEQAADVLAPTHAPPPISRSGIEIQPVRKDSFVSFIYNLLPATSSTEIRNRLLSLFPEIDLQTLDIVSKNLADLKRSQLGRTYERLDRNARERVVLQIDRLIEELIRKVGAGKSGFMEYVRLLTNQNPRYLYPPARSGAVAAYLRELYKSEPYLAQTHLSPLPLEGAPLPIKGRAPTNKVLTGTPISQDVLAREKKFYDSILRLADPQQSIESKRVFDVHKITEQPSSLLQRVWHAVIPPPRTEPFRIYAIEFGYKPGSTAPPGGAGRGLPNSFVLYNLTIKTVNNQVVDVKVGDLLTAGFMEGYLPKEPEIAGNRAAALIEKHLFNLDYDQLRERFKEQIERVGTERGYRFGTYSPAHFASEAVRDFESKVGIMREAIRGRGRAR